jgi:FkbM family methyltransferase
MAVNAAATEGGVPARAAQVGEALRRLASESTLMSGAASKARLARMRIERFRRGELDEPPRDTELLCVKPLGGRELHFRPRTADIDMLQYSFKWNRHLPPPELGSDVRRIVELGTNIATSLSDLAHRYPNAEVLGVEPDPGNAAVARLNLAELGSRAQLIEAGAWDVDAQLVVERDRREWGLVVRPRRPDDPPEWPTIRARAVGSLLEEFAGQEPIDFMYMDVEGGELRLLTSHAEWAQRVRAITVEVEREYDGDIPATEAALADLGFATVRTRDTGGIAFVTGLR